MTTISLKGSCLCGLVKYQVGGGLVRFSHCHCSRCRKATGTGHATNLLVSPVQSLQWTCGEEMLATYKVPGAERFYNCFCARCGSPMPRTFPQIDAVLIPAGSIDSELDIKPEHRIFWNSRAEWSCLSGDLPVFEEYPVADE